MKKINKEDFLKILESMSIQDINNLIKNKGKQPKLITPVVFIKSNKKISI